MKTKLITALRAAARSIESGTIDYDWAEQCRCNCGVLACALTGSPPSKLSLPSVKGGLTWQQIVGRHCPITGLPEQVTLRAMFEAGLTQQDIIELENLSNPAVCERAGFGRKVESEQIIPGKPESGFWFWKTPAAPEIRVTKTTTTKANLKAAADVVAYMRAWADLLTEQGVMDIAPAPQEVVAATNKEP